MDRRERLQGDWEENFRVAFRGLMSGVWTALPGTIQSFDDAAQTVVVQPAIQAQKRNPDGSTSWITMPLLLDVPVQFPSGGNHTLTFPVVQGDECLVVFASRCIDAWWQLGGVQPQMEFRFNDLSDGFALLGFRSQPRVLSGVSTTTTQLRSDDGQTHVEVDGTGKIVTLKAATKVTIDAPILEVSGSLQVLNSEGSATPCTIQGKLTATGDIQAGSGTGGQVGLLTHTHPDPQGGNTGAPNGGT